jgi:four helix bundle protein
VWQSLRAEAVMRVRRFDFKELDVYQAALAHYEWCLDVASRISPDRKVITWQMLKASLSVLLNLGEAGGRRGAAESAQYLRVARGSAFECAAMLDGLAAMEVITDDEYNVQEQLLARVGAMLSTMIRRKTGPSG